MGAHVLGYEARSPRQSPLPVRLLVGRLDGPSPQKHQDRFLGPDAPEGTGDSGSDSLTDRGGRPRPYGITYGIHYVPPAASAVGRLIRAPVPPRRIIVISARIETAISAGVSAPMSRPTGVETASSAAAG